MHRTDDNNTINVPQLCNIINEEWQPSFAILFRPLGNLNETDITLLYPIATTTYNPPSHVCSKNIVLRGWVSSNKLLTRIRLTRNIAEIMIHHNIIMVFLYALRACYYNAVFKSARLLEEVSRVTLVDLRQSYKRVGLSEKLWYQQLVIMYDIPKPLL